MILNIDGKRGIAYHMILWIPKMVYFIIVFTTVFGFIILFANSEAYLGGVEARVLMHRIYFYPDDFLSRYEPGLRRPYLGTTGMKYDPDHNLFSEHLERILFYEKKNLPLKIQVNRWAPERSFAIGTSYFPSSFRNKDLYESWEPIANFVDQKDEIKGKGRVFSYRDSRTLSRDEDQNVLKINLFIQDE